MIATRWVEQGFSATLVLHSVGLASSTYYNHKTLKLKNADNEPKSSSIRSGRPAPGYAYTYLGQKIPDEEIKEFLMEEISGDGYPYGYRKLTASMQEDYNLNIVTTQV